MIRPPHSPESVESLRARYRAAVARVWTVAELMGGAWGDGFPPESLFDCLDGLRLTIAREDHGPDGVLIHCAASMAPRSRLHRSALSGRLSPRAFFLLALERFRVISGTDPRAGVETEFSGTIPHFYVPDPEHSR